MNPGRLDTRRDFVKRAAVLPIALMAAHESSGGGAPVPDASRPMPCVPFGKFTLSRLVCGSNTFNAGSHLSVFVNHEMRAYYTPEQVLKTLRRCEKLGINAWQAGPRNLEVYHRFRAEGGRMHYLPLGRDGEEIAPLLKAGCIGIAHHGEVTDQLFKAGQLNRVNEYLKRVRDAGVMVGVSTHMPAVVDAVESKGWDIDYYMTCVYERHRTAEELKKLLGHVPLPVREVYLQEDPPRMYRMIRQTRRPCLAFKILAAGRLSEKKASVEQAFREAFAGIKPTDAIIVGLYDRYTDQPGEDADYTRRFGHTVLG